MEQLTGPQLVNKFPTFYATQRIITAFTRNIPLPSPVLTLSQINPVHISIPLLED
jgi:hypothetical protein